MKPLSSLLLAALAAPCFASSPTVEDKLKEIWFRKVDFRNASIEDVLEFLRQRSRELDPDRVGVNFVLKLNPNPAPATPTKQK
jgi:hypothetical protein